jgi:hypothetical protein
MENNGFNDDDSIFFSLKLWVYHNKRARKRLREIETGAK